MAKHPRISHVTGTVVHFSQGLEVAFGFVFVADGPSVAEVFGPFGFEKAFARPFKGQVRVRFMIHPSKHTESTKLLVRKNSSGLVNSP